MRTSKSLFLFVLFGAVLLALPSGLLGGSGPGEAPGLLSENRERSAETIISRVAEVYQEAGFGLGEGWRASTHIQETKSGKMLRTGGGFHASDIELFLRISEKFPVRSIFIVGNAFGYSTFCLSEIFKGAVVDAIDAEIEGKDNRRGSEITRAIAQKHYPNVRLIIGFSPQDTPKAVHPDILKKLKGYDLVFIDGKHTNGQMVKDFVGLIPFLSPRCVVAFHDVGLYKMHQGFKAVKKRPARLALMVLSKPSSLPFLERAWRSGGSMA